jgi:hypothetical protein
MKKEPRTKADAFFWIFGVAAIATAISAVNTMSEDQFWAAACFGLMAGCVYLYTNSGETP